MSTFSRVSGVKIWYSKFQEINWRCLRVTDTGTTMTALWYVRVVAVRGNVLVLRITCTGAADLELPLELDYNFWAHVRDSKICSISLDGAL